MDNKTIVQRVDALLTQRGPVEAKWEEIDRYILPLRQGSFAKAYDAESGKDWATYDVWDSTAPIGAERLASMLHSAFLSGRWFGANFREAEVNQDPTVRSVLDTNIDRVYDALESSNFALEMATAMLDNVGYGNYALSHSLVSETAWEGMDFVCHAVREMLFEEDYLGRPYRAYRRIFWTATQIVSKFKDEDGNPLPGIPKKILKADASGQTPDEKYEVIFAVYPRPGKKPLQRGERTRAPLERPFGWKYVLREGMVTLEEGGFMEFSIYHGRWSVAADSKWGYGPSLLALPTVKLSNAILEQTVNAGAKAIDPVTIVTERGLLSDLDQSPGGLVTVRSKDDIDILESKARFDVSEMLLTTNQMMIRKLFREDDIGLRDSPAMTATEVNRRFVLMNKHFGPQNKRAQFDVFAPVIQNTFNMMARMGQLEPWPDKIRAYAEAKGREPRLQITFYGPLQTAMRDDEVTNIERLLTAKSAMVKMDPNSRAKFVVKDDVALREMAERLATPAAALATQEEVDAAADREAQMQAQAIEAETMKKTAEANRAQAGAEELAG